MKISKYAILGFNLFILVKAVLFFLLLTARVNFELNGFAVVDNQVFVGLSNRIEISENDVTVSKISINQSPATGSYIFALEENQISIYESMRKDTFDLQGNLLDTQQYDDTSVYNAKNKTKREYVDENSVTYQQKSLFGFYYIQNTQTKNVIFHMPIFDYVIKALWSTSNVAFVVMILCFLIKAFQYQKETHGTLFGFRKDKRFTIKIT